MEDDLSKSLRLLRSATNKLNTLTDRANDLVRRTERYLNDECRVGGPVNVHIEALDQRDESNDGAHYAEWASYLGYERHKGEHRIMVTHVIDADPHESKPWAECSRDIKLKAIEALPDLIKELLKKVLDQVAEVEDKLDSLDNVIPPEPARISRILDDAEKA